MLSTTESGKEGERIAREYLVSSGHEVLEVNWRYARYEIDIISKHGSFIVFTEVKLRSTGAFGEPEVFVNRQKQSRLVKAANFYLLDRDIRDEARFDVIAITPGTGKLKHIQNAFYPLAK